MPKHYIYCIFENEEPYYVGQSIDPYQRILDHIGLKKYNGGDQHTILATTRSKKRANELERDYVQLFESYGFKLKNVWLKKDKGSRVFVKRSLKYDDVNNFPSN